MKTNASCNAVARWQKWKIQDHTVAWHAESLCWTQWFGLLNVPHQPNHSAYKYEPSLLTLLSTPTLSHYHIHLHDYQHLSDTDWRVQTRCHWAMGHITVLKQPWYQRFVPVTNVKWLSSSKSQGRPGLKIKTYFKSSSLLKKVSNSHPKLWSIPTVIPYMAWMYFGTFYCALRSKLNDDDHNDNQYFLIIT